MPFEFSLAAVLRYRESLEQREQLALERLQQATVVVEKSIRTVDEACSHAAKSRAHQMNQGMVAAEVQTSYEYQVSLERQREALRAQLQTLKVQWQRQLRNYESARRNRETLEKLRCQQLEAYNLERARRVQRAIDDAHLARLRRRR